MCITKNNLKICVLYHMVIVSIKHRGNREPNTNENKKVLFNIWEMFTSLSNYHVNDNLSSKLLIMIVYILNYQHINNVLPMLAK